MPESLEPACLLVLSTSPISFQLCPAALARSTATCRAAQAVKVSVTANGCQISLYCLRSVAGGTRPRRRAASRHRASSTAKYIL